MIHNSCEIQYLTKFFTFNLGFMKTMAFYLWPQGKENVEGIALLLAQLHCVSHCYKYIYRKGKKLQSKQWLFMTSTKTLVSISCNHCWNSFYGLLLNHLSNFFFFYILVLYSRDSLSGHEWMSGAFMIFVTDLLCFQYKYTFFPSRLFLIRNHVSL